MNLYEKIVEIMKDVHYLQKDDTVGTGKSSYKAISEQKVTSAVRNSLIKHKVVVIPVKQDRREVYTEYEKENTYQGTIEKKQRLMTEVDVTYRIINADAPDEFIEAVSSGSGVDSQDKGIGKAMTYAHKYLMLRTFAIPTGEDPDKEHNDDLEKGSTVIKPTTNNNNQNTLEEELVKAVDSIYKLSKKKGLSNEELYKIAKDNCGSSYIKKMGKDNLVKLHEALEKI